MNFPADFARPDLWPALLAVPPAALLLAGALRRRHRRAETLAGPRLAGLARGLSPVRRRTGVALFSLGLLLALLAALQPLGAVVEGAAAPRGVDLVFCLDVSRSMLAGDVAPSRLAFAKADLRRLAAKAPGNRFALVLFAGTAEFRVPLTHDLRSFVEIADTADPLTAPRGGSDPGAALRVALRALEGRTGRHEAVVLLSDGEDGAGTGIETARALADRGITVHTVGLGTRGGAKIPDEAGGFVRDGTGVEVITRLDEERLRRIAALTGGAYVTGEEPLLRLYEERIVPLAKRSYGPEAATDRQNHFQWPLLAAVLLWMAELSLLGRRH